jgi:hypothetical protein
MRYIGMPIRALIALICFVCVAVVFTVFNEPDLIKREAKELWGFTIGGF